MMLCCREPHLNGSTESFHLGHVLVMTNDDVSDIRRCCDSFCKKVNLFCARFGHLPVIIKPKLFQSFCLSFYGSQLWDLSHNALQYLDTAWHKATSRVCNLPNIIQSAILPFFMDGYDFHALIYSFIHFHIVVYLVLI